MEETLGEILIRIHDYIIKDEKVNWVFTSSENRREDLLCCRLVTFEESTISWTLIEILDDSLLPVVESFFEKIGKSDNPRHLWGGLVLLNAIDISDFDFHERICKTFFSSIHEDLIEHLITEMIEDLNAKVNFPHLGFVNEVRDYRELSYLCSQLQGCYRVYHSPIKCVSLILKNVGRDIFSEIYGKLNDFVFCASVEIGQTSEYFWYEKYDILQGIAGNRIASSRIAVILCNMGDLHWKLAREDLLFQLCIQYWNDIGVALLEKVFRNWLRFRTISHFELVEKVVANVVGWFNTCGNYSYFTAFEWPETFISYSGMIFYSNKSITGEVNLDASICDAYCSRILQLWNSNSVENEIAGSSQPFGLYSIGDQQIDFLIRLTANYLFTYEKQDIIVRLVKDRLYQLKTMLYSSVRVSMKAREQVAFLLYLVLSSTKTEPFNDLFKKNVENISKLIIDIVLYPFVSQCDLLDEIWNAENSRETKRWSTGSECLFRINILLYEIKQLDAKSKRYQAFESMLVAWQKYAETEWPWMRKDFGQSR